MTQEELLADTNRLLQLLLEIDRKQKEDSERHTAEFESKMTSMKSEREEAMRSRLKDKGLPESLTDTSGEELERRREEAQARTKQNMEAMRQKDQEYKDRLLQELQTHSDLLKQIAARLEP